MVFRLKKRSDTSVGINYAAVAAGAVNGIWILFKILRSPHRLGGRGSQGHRRGRKKPGRKEKRLEARKKYRLRPELDKRSKERRNELQRMGAAAAKKLDRKIAILNAGRFWRKKKNGAKEIKQSQRRVGRTGEDFRADYRQGYSAAGRKSPMKWRPWPRIESWPGRCKKKAWGL